MTPNISPIINAHRAPKGQPHDRQHHNVMKKRPTLEQLRQKYLKQVAKTQAEIRESRNPPATRWADWDEALKLRNEVRR
jgi:hypothetical protein